MANTSTSASKVSNFFLNTEEQVNLSEFLDYTAETIENIGSSLEDIDLSTFDNLDEEEKLYLIGDLWYAADITASEIEGIIHECELSVDDYRNLSNALSNWKDGDPNPLTDRYLMSSFRWVKGKRGRKKRIIYELRHEGINILCNYTLEELFPYLEEKYFTKEALDFIKKSNH